MSYDFDAYVAVPVPAAFLRKSGEGWQLNVYDATPVQPEDLAQNIRDVIGDRRLLIQLHLEGDEWPGAQEVWERSLFALIEHDDAVIIDLQTDTVMSAQGSTQLVAAPPPKPRAAPLTMAFYRDPTLPFGRAERIALLDAMERATPKALPRRYGCWEPMPHTYAETGRDHFLELWEAEDDIFWRSTAPFGWGFQGLGVVNEPADAYNAMGGFRCARLELEISATVLKSPKRKHEMLTLFKEISQTLDVFYAELVSGETSTRAWFWRGIPIKKTLLSAIGAPYVDLWPTYISDPDTQRAETLYFRDGLTQSAAWLSPPDDLKAPALPLKNPLHSKPPLASVFPFAVPRRPEHSSRR